LRSASGTVIGGAVIAQRTYWDDRIRAGARRCERARHHRTRDHLDAADDDLLVAGEVAALLRVTTAWVYAETRRGALPYVRLGRYVRYRRTTVLEWLASQELHRAR
jgi:excisionase family DNA binding protein